MLIDLTEDDIVVILNLLAFLDSTPIELCKSCPDDFDDFQPKLMSFIKKIKKIKEEAHEIR